MFIIYNQDISTYIIIKGAINMNQSKTVIQERQRQLFEYIKKHNSIKVLAASKKLQVSELTVRRDLEELEKKNLITRFHGGASMNSSFSEYDIILEEKQVQNEHVKNCIGRQAVSLIQDGSTVFLNSGSTVLSVLKQLNNKNVRVVTNNALAAPCVWSDHLELIMTGGECRNRSKSLIGSFALNVINSIYGNYCVLGVNGISSMGTTTSVHQETTINDAMVKRCDGKVIIVADGSKIGKSYNFISIPIQDVDILITDSSADPSELEKIAAKGVKIITVDL